MTWHRVVWNRRRVRRLDALLRRGSFLGIGGLAFGAVTGLFLALHGTHRAQGTPAPPVPHTHHAVDLATVGNRPRDESKIRVPFRGPAPLLLAQAFMPFVGVRPELVLYANRTVIYRNPEGADPRYLTADLTPEEFNALVQRWLGDEAFPKLHERYDPMPYSWDVPEAVVVMWSGETMHKVRARGFFTDGPQTGVWGEGPGEAIPGSFARLYSEIVGFRSARARTWVPDYTEVTLFPYEEAPDDPPVEWPVSFPGLDAPLAISLNETSLRNGEPTLHVLYLPGKDEAELWRLVRARREKQAVLIAGKKWSPELREVFPGEWEWRRPL